MQKKNILILDCGTKRHGVGGKFNHWLADTAMEELQNMGHTVEISLVDRPLETAAEVQKIKKADVVILQTPIWWLSPPWTFKKYQDEIFTEEELLGTGGLLKDKQYMISSTWDDSNEDFSDPKGIFEGKSVEDLLLPVHKSFQYLGMTKLPSFTILGVDSDPTHQQDLDHWKEHLNKVFG